MLQSTSWFGRRPWLLALVLLAACAPFCIPQGGTEKLSTALPGDSKETPAKVPADALGLPSIAPTPRNFPDHKTEDIEKMFELTAGVAKGSVMIYQWSMEDRKKIVTYLVDLARQRDLTPIVALSPTTLDQGRKELDLPKTLRPKKISFATKEIRTGFIEAAEEFARLEPPYLCLATEINFLALQRLEEFLHFASLYKEAYRAVKKISPKTKVFVSFQYEWVRILDNKAPGKRQDHAKVIEIFRPELDLVAITTYPAEFTETPADLPANYYSYFREYLKPGEEVMVMEIGWPSAGKGSPATQEQFIRRLPALLADLSPKVTAWALLHDVKLAAFTDNFASAGLMTRDGKTKPSLEAWKAVAPLPQSKPKPGK